MADFEKALAKVLEHEGAYSCDENDPGGATAWGITEREARMLGYDGQMQDLPMELVKRRYRGAYWDPIQGDAQPDQAIAERMFDSGVNIGIERVTTHLQLVLNALNKQQKLYPNIVPDGIFGKATLETLSWALGTSPLYRGYILAALRAFQITRYVELCEKNEKLETFLPGWLNRAEGI